MACVLCAMITSEDGRWLASLPREAILVESWMTGFLAARILSSQARSILPSICPDHLRQLRAIGDKLRPNLAPELHPFTMFGLEVVRSSEPAFQPVAADRFADIPEDDDLASRLKAKD